MKRALFLLAVCALVGCRKSTEDWLSDLRDGEPFARTLAAIALRETALGEEERVVAALLRVSPSRSDELRQHADESLRHIARRSPTVLATALLADDVDPVRIGDVLATAGTEAIEMLEGLLDDEPESRQAAIALGRCGAAGITALVARAGRGDPNTIAMIVIGLDAAGDPGSAPITQLMTKLCERLDAKPREQDPTIPVALETASQYSTRAAWAIVAAVDHKPTGSQQAAIAAVIRGLLLSMLREEPDLAGIVPIIGHLGSRAHPPLIDALLQHDEPRVHHWAQVALAMLGTSSIPAMLARGADEDWVAFIAESNGAAGIAAVREAAKSTTQPTREAAERVLQKLEGR